MGENEPSEISQETNGSQNKITILQNHLANNYHLLLGSEISSKERYKLERRKRIEETLLEYHLAEINAEQIRKKLFSK